MEKLKFVFNEKKVQEAGKSVEGIMKPIRERLLSSGVREDAPLEFVIDGTDSESVFTILVVKLTENDYGFIDLLDSWTLESDEGIEDCIQETKNWYRRKGILYSE